MKFYFTSVWEEAVLAEQAAAAELVLLEKAVVEEYHDLEKKHHDKLEADKKAEEARAAAVTVKDDAEVHKL